MAKDRADWRAVADANAQRLQSEIEHLKGKMSVWEVNYGDFWKHVKEVSGLFKNLKPLVREERERLWSEFSSTCDSAKAEQQRRREKRSQTSAQKRSLVESKLRDAYHQAKGSGSPSDLSKAKDLLNEALGWMKNGWGGFSAATQIFTLSDGRMTKADHDACWDKWKEVNETVKYRRKELGDLNYGEFKSGACNAISTADYNPREAKDKVKSIQARLRGVVMSRDQFDEIRQLLDQAWQRASARQEAKRDEWRNRTRSALAHKKSLIDKAEGVIARLEDQIDRCRDLERSARSSDFESTVRGWIEEKYDKISDIRRSIRELEDQIRSIEAKLN